MKALAYDTKRTEAQQAWIDRSIQSKEPSTRAVSSWWAAPAVQHDRAAFDAAAAQETPRIRGSAMAKKAWPIDQSEVL